MANPEHLQHLTTSVEHWNNWRTANPTERPDLSLADLTGADLTGADLFGADLTGADLTEADLTEADLSEADLTEADLTEANLVEANLTGAYLVGANLVGANLTGADLTEADLTEADLSEAYLAEAYLAGANLTAANLGAANLVAANLTGANLTGARWRPDNPPAWPEGFTPPENAWEQEPTGPEPDAPPTSTAVYQPVRADRVDEDHLFGLMSGLESLVSWVRNQLHDDQFSENDAVVIEHVLGSLDRELYHNPGERNPTVITAHFADLVGRVRPYLPAEVAASPDTPVDEDAARRVVNEAAQLGAADPSDDTPHAAGAADALAETIEPQLTQDPSGDHEEPTDRRSGAIKQVMQTLAWGTAGGLGGAQGIPALLSWFSPVWAAVIGATVSVLTNLYLATGDPNNDDDE